MPSRNAGLLLPGRAVFSNPVGELPVGPVGPLPPSRKWDPSTRQLALLKVCGIKSPSQQDYGTLSPDKELKRLRFCSEHAHTSSPVVTNEHEAWYLRRKP